MTPSFTVSAKPPTASSNQSPSGFSILPVGPTSSRYAIFPRSARFSCRFCIVRAAHCDSSSSALNFKEFAPKVLVRDNIAACIEILPMNIYNCLGMGDIPFSGFRRVSVPAAVNRFPFRRRGIRYGFSETLKKTNQDHSFRSERKLIAIQVYKIAERRPQRIICRLNVNYL